MHELISIDAALELIREQTGTCSTLRVPTLEAAGLVLAESIASDIDSPPHDKALVDGYAVIAGDLLEGVAELQVCDQIMAGETPRQTVSPGTTARIMTGAPIPSGADAVVMVERTEQLSDAIVRITTERPTAGDNILTRATSLRRDEIVLSRGTYLRAIEIGLLSEVGRSEVTVYQRPSVSVIATGNELVPANRVPKYGEIRNSNGPMLTALATRAGADSYPLGIGRDQPDQLERLVRDGLERDVLLLSGGVSAGDLDLVPAVLSSLGVKQVFHKVRLKPGKPLWFGTRGDGRHNCLVFALPGNPVSSLVTFELFVRPALRQLAGDDKWIPNRLPARLAEPMKLAGDRATYFPGLFEPTCDGGTVHTLNWHGSADLRTLASANCLAVFPEGKPRFSAGELVDVQMLA